MSGCLCFSHARCRSCNGRNAFKSSFFPSPLFINPRIIVLVSRVQKRKTTPTQPIAGARHDVKRTCGWDKDTNERIGAKINQGRKETIRIWPKSHRITSHHAMFNSPCLPSSINSHRRSLSLRHVRVPFRYLVCLGYCFPTQLLDRLFFLLRLALPLLLSQPLHFLFLAFHHLIKLLSLLGALFRAEGEGHDGETRNDTLLVKREPGWVRCPVCLGTRHRMEWVRLPWLTHCQPFFCLARFQSCIYPERKSNRLRQLCHRQRGTLSYSLVEKKVQHGERPRDANNQS